MRAAALIEGAAANSRARRRVDRKAGRVYDNPLPFWVPPRYYRLPRLLRDPRQLLGDAIIPVYADLGEAHRRRNNFLSRVRHFRRQLARYDPHLSCRSRRLRPRRGVECEKLRGNRLGPRRLNFRGSPRHAPSLPLRDGFANKGNKSRGHHRLVTRQLSARCDRS
jgi:hypothetical protein